MSRDQTFTFDLHLQTIRHVNSLQSLCWEIGDKSRSWNNYSWVAMALADIWRMVGNGSRHAASGRLNLKMQWLLICRCSTSWGWARCKLQGFSLRLVNKRVHYHSLHHSHRVSCLHLHLLGQTAVKLCGAEAADQAQCAAGCPWLTNNPTTKAKGYILLKEGQRQKQKALSFLHKGIINNNSFTLELVIN